MTLELTGVAQELLDRPFSAPILASEIAFKGAVWDVRRDRFRFGDGELVREYLDHTGAVAVIALDENDRVLLIRQYRHPVRAYDLELPAGLMDEAGESPLATAQRELAEEADLRAENWSVLVEFMTSSGGSNEAVRVYLARGLSATERPFARTDEESDIQLVWADLDEVVTAALGRRVQNGILVTAALAAKASRDRGWEGLGAASTPWERHPSARAWEQAD